MSLCDPIRREYCRRSWREQLADVWTKEDYLAIGLPGIFVVWGVTPIVLICTYIFGQKVSKYDCQLSSNRNMVNKINTGGIENEKNGYQFGTVGFYSLSGAGGREDMA
jgi:hypothetical protein